jgi:hypothetical protein
VKSWMRKDAVTLSDEYLVVILSESAVADEAKNLLLLFTNFS